MKVPTERLTAILDEFRDTISTLPPVLPDGPGAVSALYSSLSLAEVEGMASELLELREAVRKAWLIVDEVLIGPDPDEALASLIDVLKAASAPNPVDEVQP